MCDRYQSRAFLLLPMCFNVGVIIGPVLGGILADPEGTYPDIFGPGTFLGGEDGVWWMRQWPYALPNMLSAIFLTCSATCVILGLEEVSKSRFPKHPTSPDPPRPSKLADTSPTWASGSAATSPPSSDASSAPATAAMTPSIT